MNILFLAHRLPYPPDKGDKIRSFNILKYLSRKHDVTLSCLVDSKHDLKYIGDLEQYCETVDWVSIHPWFRRLFSLKALFARKTLSVAYFYSRSLQRKIDQRLRETPFDLIFAYSSQMAEYVKSVPNIKRVIDLVDVDSRKWQQYATYQNSLFYKWIYALESRRLAAYEAWVARTFDCSILVSDAEANTFRRQICDNGKIAAIHNGVDCDFFSPGHTHISNGRKPHRPVILFTGAMDYYPNIDAVQWFLHEIFPLIKRSVAQVQFYIVGRNPGQDIKKLHTGDDVVVTGYVKDIREYFDKADVFVASFRIACGIQNKILEALAMRLPVVATSIGAEGLKMKNCPVIETDWPDDFARETVVCLQSSQDLPDDSLRQWVIEHYDWQRNLSDLDKLLPVSP